MIVQLPKRRPAMSVAGVPGLGGDGRHIEWVIARRLRSLALVFVIAVGIVMTACGQGLAGFSALNGRYLPDTTRSTWTALAEHPLAGTSETLVARSKNGRFYVELFDFASSDVASAFYERPGGGTVEPIPGATGIVSPARGLLYAPCGSGLACTAEVGTMALRSRVVIFVFWLTKTQTAGANNSYLSTIAPYVKGCLTLLSSVGLPS